MKNTNQKNSKVKSVMSVILKLLLTLAAITVILFGGSVVILVLMSEDIRLPLTYIGGYFLPALLLPAIWLKKRKTYMKIWLVAALLYIAVIGTNFGMIKYDNTIKIDTSSYEFEETTTDAIVFFVHKDNPVDNLTAGQIREIYSGEIENWKEVGGRNRKIKAFQNGADSELQSAMERFMGETELMEAPTEQVYGYLYEVVEEVSPYRNKVNSIGFGFRQSVEGNPDVKLLTVDGTAPTQENIENGSYPLVATITVEVEEEIIG